MAASGALKILPGILLALALAFLGQFLSDFVGITLMGLPKSPISAIMLAILLGILVGNLVELPESFKPGIAFGLKRILRIGIVLLGIRLSLAEAGAIGLQSLPIIIGAVATALIVVTYFGKRMGLSGRLGVLIAGGTSICGATAIVAMAPAVRAKDSEVSYAVACITIFGVVAMLVYPFLGYWIFDGDDIAAGLFLGTSVHETAQVAGAGLVYQQFYNSPEALDVATVTKLVRNLGMLVVIPLMSIIYVRSAAEAAEAPKWYSMIPLFVVGFALMSLVRTIGDSSETPFGVLTTAQWDWAVTNTKHVAETCLAVAMAAVGLGTSIRGLQAIGMRPFAVGLFSALLVGAVSILLITLLH